MRPRGFRRLTALALLKIWTSASQHERARKRSCTAQQHGERTMSEGALRRGRDRRASIYRWIARFLEEGGRIDFNGMNGNTG